MTANLERRLAQSWARNAESWTEAVRTGRIESRRAVTDPAMVEAVLACGGSKVLDVGCGEGWLARALSSHGREVLGFDGSALLVERAREAGGGSFNVLSYAAFLEDAGAVGGDYDVVAANFSLLGEHVAPLLTALARVAAPGGRLVIQTVHPRTVVGATDDGWREETFAFLPSLDFSPMPWFFRTLESWVGVLERSGWCNVHLLEPTYPATDDIASAIFSAQRRS